MTTSSHDEAAAKCIRNINQRRNEDRARVDKFELMLHNTRDIVIEVRTMVKTLMKEKRS